MRQTKRVIMMATIAVVLAWGAGEVSARTWSVQKDGSGDFWVIQDAVDAAASGDTIRIGAGRWEDYRWEQGWVVYTWVVGKDLTFIGEGPTVTVIGKENPSFPHPTHGVAFSLDSACNVSRFEGIGFDMPGLFSRAISNLGSRVEIENCRFTRLLRAVYTEGIGGGFVRNCEFENVNYNNGGTGVMFYSPARNFVVEGCTFVGCTGAIDAAWSGAQEIVVQNCTIIGGETGVNFVSGATGSVRYCSIVGASSFGINVYAHGSIIIEDNHISVGQNSIAFMVTAGLGGTVYLRNNILEAIDRVLYIPVPGFTLVSEANHFLLNGPAGWYVQTSTAYSGPPIHFDLSGCWWGTTDVEYIAQRIMDGNNNPQMYLFFDFLPIAEQPVPVQSQSWTEVKNLFRE